MTRSGLLTAAIEAYHGATRSTQSDRDIWAVIR